MQRSGTGAAAKRRWPKEAAGRRWSGPWVSVGSGAHHILPEAAVIHSFPTFQHEKANRASQRPLRKTQGWDWNPQVLNTNACAVTGFLGNTRIVSFVIFKLAGAFFFLQVENFPLLGTLSSGLWRKSTDLTPCLVTALRSCSPHAYWMQPSSCTCCIPWLCWLSEMKKEICFAQSLNSRGVYLRCTANFYHSPHYGVGEGPGMALSTLLELLKQNEKDLTRHKTRLTFESLD